MNEMQVMINWQKYDRTETISKDKRKLSSENLTGHTFYFSTSVV